MVTAGDVAVQVLVVEDDDDDRLAMKEVLEEHGFNVIEARNGRRALDLMTSTGQPALVILDLEMPEMSGRELVDVMSRYHRLSRVPVLVVSGSMKETCPVHESVIGMLTKPFDLTALIGAVEAEIGAPSKPSA